MLSFLVFCKALYMGLWTRNVKRNSIYHILFCGTYYSVYAVFGVTVNIKRSSLHSMNVSIQSNLYALCGHAEFIAEMLWYGWFPTFLHSFFIFNPQSSCVFSFLFCGLDGFGMLKKWFSLLTGLRPPTKFRKQDENPIISLPKCNALDHCNLFYLSDERKIQRGFTVWFAPGGVEI